MLGAAALGPLGCGDNVSVDDAALDGKVDSRPDSSVVYCTIFPNEDGPLCPADRVYCCYGLETAVCAADEHAGACTEHPVNGVFMACDSTSGSGCSAEKPFCCRLGSSSPPITYCSDHAYYGSPWTCSS